MVVDGHVRMSINMNVIGLETDAVTIDSYGEVIITDPDQFLIDWFDEWNVGNGELLGASDESVYLETYREEDEEDEEYEEDEEDDY